MTVGALVFVVGMAVWVGPRERLARVRARARLRRSGAGAVAGRRWRMRWAPASWPSLRRGAADAALPEVLDAVARSLRTGASLPGALSDAARTAPPAFRHVAERARIVGALAALDEWASSDGASDAVRLAATALGLASEVGGRRAQAIDSVAATIRQRQAMAADLAAAATQARVSAATIAVSPLVFGVLVAGLDPEAVRFLFGTVAGALVLVTGLALDAVGAWWMARLCRVEP